MDFFMVGASWGEYEDYRDVDRYFTDKETAIGEFNKIIERNKKYQDLNYAGVFPVVIQNNELKGDTHNPIIEYYPEEED